jgi:hypothetical protein
MGPDTPARALARQRLLAVARRESGSFADPTVPDDEGRTVAARGIALTTSDPAHRPVTATLPLPRGEAPPNGAYVVHDTEVVRLPYLPDVAASGAALVLPGKGKVPVLASYGDLPWPRSRPARLVLHAGRAADPVGAVTARQGDRTVLDVTLPPATSVVARLSSTIAPDALAVMNTGGIDAQLARNGLAPMLSPAQEIRLTHAVQRPVQPPTLSLDATQPVREHGGTSVPVTGMLGGHRPSTSQVDAEASWPDVIDKGFGPLVEETQTAVVGSVPITPDGPAAVPFTGNLHFGDTRRRGVTVTAVGTSSFREYFAPGTRMLGPDRPEPAHPRRATPPGRAPTAGPRRMARTGWRRRACRRHPRRAG